MPFEWERGERNWTAPAADDAGPGPGCAGGLKDSPILKRITERVRRRILSWLFPARNEIMYSKLAQAPAFRLQLEEASHEIVPFEPSI